jgi:hypothetical protein
VNSGIVKREKPCIAEGVGYRAFRKTIFNFGKDEVSARRGLG